MKRSTIKELKKIGIGALIAGMGATLTYLCEAIPNVDFEQFTPLVVAVFSIIANAVRKKLAGKI